MDQEFKFDEQTKSLMSQYYSHSDIDNYKEILQKSSIMKLENGQKYRGEISSTKTRQGYGILQDKNGKDIYCGQWNNNNYDGRGLYINQDSTIIKGKKSWKNLTSIAKGWSYYEGEFKQGKMHGQGNLIFTNKENISGSFSENLIDGQGKFTDLDNNIVHGIWEKGTFRRNYIPEQNDQQQPQQKIVPSSVEPIIMPQQIKVQQQIDQKQVKIEQIQDVHQQQIGQLQVKIEQIQAPSLQQEIRQQQVLIEKIQAPIPQQEIKQQQVLIEQIKTPVPQKNQILPKTSQTKQGDQYNQIKFEEQRILISQLISMIHENEATLEEKDNTIDQLQKQIIELKNEQRLYGQYHMSERTLCDDIITTFKENITEVVNARDQSHIRHKQDKKIHESTATLEEKDNTIDQLQKQIIELKNQQELYGQYHMSERTLCDDIITTFKDNITEVVNSRNESHIRHKQDKLCQICCDMIKSYTADPCGHLYCANCMVRVAEKKECFSCRQQVTKMIKIYD